MMKRELVELQTLGYRERGITKGNLTR